MRLKIEVDAKVIYSNYEAPESVGSSDNLKDMTPDERIKLLEDPSLFSVQLDDYLLPSLLIKQIKSMKKNAVTEMTVRNNIKRMHTNFKSEVFDQYSVEAGQCVRFTVTLLSNEV